MATSFDPAVELLPQAFTRDAVAELTARHIEVAQSLDFLKTCRASPFLEARFSTQVSFDHSAKEFGPLRHRQVCACGEPGIGGQ